MIGSILAHIVEGIVRPAASVERLMQRRPQTADAALMVVAAYALQRAWNLLLLGDSASLNIAQHLFSLMVMLATTFVIGFLIFAIGRAFGGHAEREPSLVIAAWHSLVMTMLWPLLLLGAGDLSLAPGTEVSAGALLVVLVFSTQWIWLLARYTAVIHGFRSNWSVVGVILGLSMLFSTLFLMVAGA